MKTQTACVTGANKLAGSAELEIPDAQPGKELQEGRSLPVLWTYYALGTLGT